MLQRRLLATLVGSFAVALVAAAGLAGTASTAAADGVYFGFGFNDGPHGPPPPRWGWGPPPPPPGPDWGPPPPPRWGWGPPPPRPGWGPPPPICRSRWVDRPVVDPWGRIVRYQRVEVVDCGPPRHRPRW